jgi:hypothetical protein
MTDELDRKTDDEISDIFAREVAGWKFTNEDDFNKGLSNGEGFDLVEKADFATNANAVLPWLEKYKYFDLTKRDCDFMISIYLDVNKNLIITNATGVEKTFARAACITLIRAKRSEKGKSQ